MPNINSVVDFNSFIEFGVNFFTSIIDIIKSIWSLITNLFNASYYYNIFSHLPNPFGTIMLTLIGVTLFVLLSSLLKLIKFN